MTITESYENSAGKTNQPLEKRGILSPTQALGWKIHHYGRDAGWKYPTWHLDGNFARWRWKAADKTTARQRFSWIGSGSTPHYYHSPHIKKQVDRAGGRLYLTEGETDYFSLIAAEIFNAMALLKGGSAIPASLVDDLRYLGVTDLIYLPDLDETGRKSAARIAAILGGSGISFTPLLLPAELGEKSDVNDLWQRCAFDPAAMQTAIQQLAAMPLPEPDHPPPKPARHRDQPRYEGDDVIQRIKDSIDLYEYVRRDIELKKSGKYYKGKFRGEKTASFTIYQDTNSYYDFGDPDNGGDIFNYVMRRDGVDFKTALRTLAAEAGIELESRPAHQSRNLSAAPEDPSDLRHFPQGNPDAWRGAIGRVSKTGQLVYELWVECIREGQLLPTDWLTVTQLQTCGEHRQVPRHIIQRGLNELVRIHLAASEKRTNQQGQPVGYRLEPLATAIPRFLDVLDKGQIRSEVYDSTIPDTINHHFYPEGAESVRVKRRDGETGEILYLDKPIEDAIQQENEARQPLYEQHEAARQQAEQTVQKQLAATYPDLTLENLIKAYSTWLPDGTWHSTRDYQDMLLDVMANRLMKSQHITTQKQRAHKVGITPRTLKKRLEERGIVEDPAYKQRGIITAQNSIRALMGNQYQGVITSEDESIRIKVHPYNLPEVEQTAAALRQMGHVLHLEVHIGSTLRNETPEEREARLIKQQEQAEQQTKQSKSSVQRSPVASTPPACYPEAYIVAQMAMTPIINLTTEERQMFTTVFHPYNSDIGDSDLLIDIRGEKLSQTSELPELTDPEPPPQPFKEPDRAGDDGLVYCQFCGQQHHIGFGTPPRECQTCRDVYRKRGKAYWNTDPPGVAPEDLR